MLKRLTSFSCNEVQLHFHVFVNAVQRIFVYGWNSRSNFCLYLVYGPQTIAVNNVFQLSSPEVVVKWVNIENMKARKSFYPSPSIDQGALIVLLLCSDL